MKEVVKVHLVILILKEILKEKLKEI